MVVNPPQKGDDSFALFEKEKRAVLDSQLEKATMIKGAFKEMDSVECFGRIGALYLFPRLNKLPNGNFIPPINLLQNVLPRWIEFHNQFVNSN